MVHRQPKGWFFCVYMPSMQQILGSNPMENALIRRGLPTSLLSSLPIQSQMTPSTPSYQPGLMPSAPLPTPTPDKSPMTMMPQGQSQTPSQPQPIPTHPGMTAVPQPKDRGDIIEDELIKRWKQYNKMKEAYGKPV